MLSMLFPMLWNAADNDVGVGPACSATDYNNCNGAALVGGPDTTDLDMLGKMTPDKLEAQMSKLGAVRAPALPCRATRVAAAARSIAACAGAGLWHRCPRRWGLRVLLRQCLMHTRVAAHNVPTNTPTSVCAGGTACAGGTVSYSGIRGECTTTRPHITQEEARARNTECWIVFWDKSASA
jgi:hypothetical protein